MKMFEYIYKPIAWVIMSPFLPFAVLLSEIEKFGKYIKWGRISLEDAYALGLERGFEEGRAHTSHIIKELEEKVPRYKQHLLDKFESEIKFIEEKPCALDFETGKPHTYAQLFKLPNVSIRLQVCSPHEYINIPSSTQLNKMIGWV